MSVYKVVSNLKHDGAFFKAGEKIDLDESVATGLLEDGVLSLLDDEAEKVANAKPLTPKQKKAAQEEADKKAAEEAGADKPSESTGSENKPVGDKTPEKVDYSKMVKKDLLKAAKEMGVEVAPNATNAQIIELLEKSVENESEQL